MIAALLLAATVTRARSFVSIPLSAMSWVLAGLRGLPLLGRTLTATSRMPLLWPVLRTVAIAAVGLVLFGGLFASGDAIFGSWAQSLVPDLRWDSIIARIFIFVFVAGVSLAGAYLALNPPRIADLDVPRGAPVSHRWEWLVPLGVVIALFAAFLVAQATAMWGGHEYLRETTGLTYAEYVHQGFGQLTTATFLTFVVVGIATRKAPQETASDRLALKVALLDAVHADARGRRVGALPDVPLPGGLRLHDAARLRRRLRALARAAARPHGRRGRARLKGRGCRGRRCSPVRCSSSASG